MAVLTTVGRVKGALRIPGAAGAGVTLWDARIAEIIEDVEGDLLREVGHDSWAPYVRTEYPRYSPGKFVVMLDRFPVWAIAGLTLSGSASVDGTGFTWDQSGRVELIDGTAFPASSRDLSITYTTGPIQVAGTTQNELVRLATLAAARQFQQEPNAGLQSLNIRPISKAVSDPDHDAVQAEIDKILARYRRPMG